MARIEIEGLSKAHGTVRVLHEIDLEIADGELVVLVGPSGCGKSTLLRTVAGLYDATAGAIRFDGAPVAHLPPQERNVAMVFQNYALYPHMSVEENIAFSLKIRGVPRAEIARRVGEVAEMIGLAPYLKRRPRQLSGGQRQRVAMGRAMVRDAAAFLFDEPLSNLDAKLRVQMRAEVRRLQKSLGATAIYVTHDQVEAMTMGDRVVVMNGGRIEQVGAPLDLYLEPANRFVAAFIGSPPMNFLDAQADGAKARLADGQALALPVAATGKITVGLRPEHLALSDRPSPAGLRARIVERQDLGSATSFRCALANGEIEVLHQGIDPPHGEEVFVVPDPARLYLFGPDERRIAA